MSSVTVFTTPASSAEAEIVIKKSRFIGHIFPIQSVDEAEEKLASVRLQHKTATHHCFAYSAGLGVPMERFSDDGEPSGTAGRPILEVIRKQGLSNLLAVVTRYFGGTLLGAGGLVRAYTSATVEALSSANLLSCKKMIRLVATIDYTQFGKVEHELAQENYFVANQDFGTLVTLEIWVEVEEEKRLLASLADWTSGRARIQVSDPQWVGVDRNRRLVFNVWQDAALPD